MPTAYIRTNNKQLFGAMLAKYAIERNLGNRQPITVRLINVDDTDIFRSFFGTPYIRNGKTMRNDEDDLQSFTLAAFMAPELSGYQGRALVIDPDIFALTDVTELMNRDLRGKTLAARPKRGGWDTSVMVLDCAKLKHWKMIEILADLTAQRTSYEDWMSLKKESVADLEPEWNSWDMLTPATKLLHTTGRLTQPWKTGLKVDFTRSRDGDRYFGILPKPLVLKLLGRWPTTYQPHPDRNIERFFFRLLKDALNEGALTEDDVHREIAAKHVRPDLLDCARIA